MLHMQRLGARVRRGAAPVRSLSWSRQVRQQPGGERGDGGRGDEPPPKSKDALMYRELFPPILRVLAYSTAAYFALHLTWSLLERREVQERQDAELQSLQSEIRHAVESATLRKA